MPIVSRSRFGFPLLVALCLALGACTIKLAPEYDQSIVDGLTKANVTTLTLFAALADGATKATYPTYEPKYDQIVGEFDALRLQAVARPDPSTPSMINATSEKLLKLDAIPKLKTPTPEVLQNIVDLLTQMRKDHKGAGLTSAAVDLFKKSFVTKMDQALTYEKALKR